MSTTVEAAGFLLMTREAPKKFLLLKHHNRWDLPKGHAERGEQILQTALRETEEETGISASLIEVVPDFRFVIEYDVRGTKRGDYHKRVTYFLGLVPEPYSIRLTEHPGYQWFDWPAKLPIQAETIDPLLRELAEFFESKQ